MRRYPGPPDAPVCGPHQSDDNHNIDVSARPRVGLLPLCCKATGYLFQGICHLHTQQPVNGGNEGREVSSSSSQGPYLSDPGGSVPHVSYVGVWPLSMVFPLPGPGREPVWRFTAEPVPLGRRRLWCRGWPAAQMPTTVEVTYAVLCKRTAGACGKPLTRFPPTPSTPIPSPPARFHRTPCRWRNPQVTDSR